MRCTKMLVLCFAISAQAGLLALGGPVSDIPVLSGALSVGGHRPLHRHPVRLSLQLRKVVEHRVVPEAAEHHLVHGLLDFPALKDGSVRRDERAGPVRAVPAMHEDRLLGGRRPGRRTRVPRLGTAAGGEKQKGGNQNRKLVSCKSGSDPDLQIGGEKGRTPEGPAPIGDSHG